MPDFELSGPDGTKYAVTAPDENAALSAFQQLHGAPAGKEPIGPTNLVRSAARGIPIVGGLVDKAEAATEAALAPVFEPLMKPSPDSLMPEGGFGARYTKALKLQQAKDQGFDTEHPIASTAAKIGGGVASIGGALKAVPALASPLGFEGTVPQMIAKGGASGAIISAADAVARGENPTTAAEEGAVLGAAGGPVGRVIGKGVSAVKGAFTKPGPLVHADTTPVAGVDVPVPNQDPVAASKIEIARRGGAGELAQRIIQTGDEATQAALERAKGNIGESLDPATGAPRPPQDAAATVAEELQAQEQARFQTEQAAKQRAIAGTEELKRGLDTAVPAPPIAPAGVPPAGAVAPPPPVPGPQIHAESPLAASEVLSAGIQRKAEEAAAARTAAYAAKAAIPGEYDRAALGASGNAIRKDLSSGPIQNQVKINASTPKATEALDLIDETIGGHPPQAMPNAAAPMAKEAPPLTGVEIEGVRQRLNQIYGDAKRAANGPAGNASDLRAVGRVIDAFDKHITNVENAGGFSGDAKALAEARDAARASHVAYKTTFEPRNPGDTVGKNVEKIVGKFDGQEAGPDQIMSMAYGSPTEIGGTQAAQFAQRIKEVFGPQSKEWAAYKQGLLSHLVDNPDGTPRAAAEAADRIEKFLKAPKGKILGQVALTADERAAMANHVETLRASEPVALKDLGSIDKVISRITGRDGGPPASLNDVTDYLFGANSGKKGMQFQLASQLKRDLSPEGFNALRVGMWSKITGVTEGKTDLTAKRLSDNLFEFLNGSGSDLAKVLYSPAERSEMLKLAQAVKSHIPVAGSTNPSGTAPMIAKMAAKAGHAILPTLGLVHGGVPGAIVGVAADRGLTSLSNSRAAKEAAKLYYGPQPSRSGADPDFSKAAAIFARGVASGQIGANR